MFNEGVISVTAGIEVTENPHRDFEGLSGYQTEWNTRVLCTAHSAGRALSSRLLE